jgi:two-component sensor histidine kinase
MNIKAVFDKKNIMQFHDGMIVDITERKRNQQKLHSALNEKDILLREVYHRVKNNMQVIASLLRMQSRQIKDEKVLKLFKDSQNRVKSMSLVHEKLYQSSNYSKVDFSGYIRSLATLLITSYNLDPFSIKLNVNIKKLEMNITNAIPCGLIVNELISNALKHKPENEKLFLNISLEKRADEMYELNVEDSGTGIPEDFNFETTESLGMRLVYSLTDQLHGNIEIIRNHGTRIKIIFEGITPKTRKVDELLNRINIRNAK